MTEVNRTIKVVTVTATCTATAVFICHRTHVSKTVSNCFAALRQIRSIRQCVSRQVKLSMVVSLVLQRLDYGNATLVGLPAYQLSRLQSVLNAAARLVLSRSKYDHVTPLLQELHRLRIEQRIEFKPSVLAFRCLNCLALSYLSRDLYTTCVRPGGLSTSVFVVNVDARRPANAPFHRRWQRFPRDCGADMEQLVEISHIVIFTGVF